ncbi:MAG: CRISPR-associated protein (Cas Csd1) [Candidatus Scalindua rubra]|uniref:CRISPR-associated protein (Cas Csd1) n=1 Tax=Candidatus Scalindua rubra TaxID=1872076 RepID=A0A1E3XGK2_9BACT|nr:MAG: CRISPR-associated protein (Cas Csd1) [Candidatus Scalindua rubra]
MFKEIIELGRRLETGKKLPPPGYYFYGQSKPIKWIVHLCFDDLNRLYIENTEIDRARPFCGKTSGIDAHPCIDEAGYVFGIVKQKGGGTDKKAKDKHKKFLELLQKTCQSPLVKDENLKSAIWIVCSKLRSKEIEKINNFNNILNKDWVSFVFDDGSFADKHLFEHPEIQQFWLEELKERTRQNTDAGKAKTGICSICGQYQQMAKKIPVGVKVYKSNAPHPLHSYNKDAFVSYIEGVHIFEGKAHLGQCVICGDTIARTLNYLTGNELHYKIITQDRRDGKLNTDSARNQFALFWLKEEQLLRIGETTINPSDLLKNVSILMSKPDSADKNAPPPDLIQLENMLNTPWSGRDASVNIAGNEFYLLVLSPNKGRIAVRDWLNISLDKLQQNLKAFLDAQRIIDPYGKEKRCFGIPEILKEIEASNISKEPYKAVEIGNPNLSRQLLRTAYLDEQPPSVLLEAAVMCMRNMKIFDEKKMTTQHVLMATLKMHITYRKEGLKEMETLDPNRHIIGYLCGRLLSILEEAQLRPVLWKINTTLVDRFYGSASSAPASVFGTLVRRATTDHFPKIRKRQLGYKALEELMESVQSEIDHAGGYPKTLSLEGQAEFSLGFYHQRAKFGEERAKNKKQKENKEKNNE